MDSNHKLSLQEFHFTAPNKATATLLHPKGALVRGGYGHSAIYDESSKMIFVFGGQNSFLSDSTVVDTLYAYLPYQNKWRIMASSKSARYFHSAALINGKVSKVETFNLLLLQAIARNC